MNACVQIYCIHLSYDISPTRITVYLCMCFMNSIIMRISHKKQSRSSTHYIGNDKDQVNQRGLFLYDFYSELFGEAFVAYFTEYILLCWECKQVSAVVACELCHANSKKTHEPEKYTHSPDSPHSAHSPHSTHS